MSIYGIVAPPAIILLIETFDLFQLNCVNILSAHVFERNYIRPAAEL